MNTWNGRYALFLILTLFQLIESSAPQTSPYTTAGTPQIRVADARDKQDAGAEERRKWLSQIEVYERKRRHAGLASRDSPESASVVEQRETEWVQQIEYSGRTFFDGWDFFTARSNTWNYIDRETALDQGLAFWTENGTAGIQVEHWAQTEPGTPRNSVRIHSKALFAGGLFLIDLRLMPWGCGVWPAVWTLGYEAAWPITGEIDIVEGIQSMTNNQMTIHTLPGCVLNTAPGLFSGSVANPVCDSTTGGTGCSIICSSNTSYGMRFNELGGGVFACLWDGRGIKIWNWNRAEIPADISINEPNPETWGLPTAAWDASTCDPYKFFLAQQLVLNINLCGDWAGDNYGQYPYCPGTCAEYVSNPLNLNNTVMLVNSIKVFQQADVEPLQTQASTSNNQTGVGGRVPGVAGDAIPGTLTQPTNGGGSIWQETVGARGLWAFIIVYLAIVFM